MLIKMKLTLKNWKVILLPVIFFFVCTAMPIISLAQAGFEVGTGPTDNTDGGVTDTPIDGGVVLLVIAGILFGVYALYRQRKSQLAVGN